MSQALGTLSCLGMRMNDEQDGHSEKISAIEGQSGESSGFTSFDQRKDSTGRNINGGDDGSDRLDRYAMTPSTGKAHPAVACSQNGLYEPKGTIGAYMEKGDQLMMTSNGSRGLGSTQRGYQSVEIPPPSRHSTNCSMTTRHRGTSSAHPTWQQEHQCRQPNPDDNPELQESSRCDLPSGETSSLLEIVRRRIALNPKESYATHAPRRASQANRDEHSTAGNDFSMPSSPSGKKGPQELEDGGCDYLDLSPVAESYERGRWLLGLLVLQSTSSSVLDHYQDLLRDHVVITLFLTMLVGAGGNAGNQSAIKVIRGLATGRFTADTACALRVIGEQARVGLMLGVALSAGGLIRVLATDGTTLRDATAISMSLFLIVMTSVVLGAALPFGLARMGVDPGHAGTTIQVAMDILGVTVTCFTCSLVLEQLQHALPPVGL